MTEQEKRTVESVTQKLERAGVSLQGIVKAYRKIHTTNPPGFEFECSDSNLLFKRVLESGCFGPDTRKTLYNFVAGSNARRAGYHSSFRMPGKFDVLHIQIGDTKCEVHIDAVGIVTGRDENGSIFDLSKIVEHWEVDLRPEMGALKNFDLTVLRGKSELTGTKELGVMVGYTKRF